MTGVCIRELSFLYNHLAQILDVERIAQKRLYGLINIQKLNCIVGLSLSLLSGLCTVRRAVDIYAVTLIIAGVEAARLTFPFIR